MIYKENLSLKTETMIDKQYVDVEHMNLKGIGQVYINWKTKRRHLQSMLGDAVTSPRYPPHSTLA
jgi:hypothetical protein